MATFDNINISALEAVSVKKLPDIIHNDAARLKSAIFDPVGKMAEQVNNAFGAMRENFNTLDIGITNALSKADSAQSAADSAQATKVSKEDIDADGVKSYIGKDVGVLTVSSGVHIFTNCKGTLNVTSTLAKVFITNCYGLSVDNKNKGQNVIIQGTTVGTILFNIAGLSPNDYIGGTWERIDHDAYFKIVTSNAGVLGGTTNNHTIPIESMPRHDHPILMQGSEVNGSPTVAIGVGNWGNWNALPSLDKGGGQPYYPRYYGVYAWLRTA